MKGSRKTLLWIVALIGAILSQGNAQGGDTVPTEDAGSHYILPNPSHIPFMLPSHIKWRGSAARGVQEYTIFGNPRKPGWYAILLKWYPGHYSRPHFHPHARYITVLSGVWWVSSSNTYDPSKTYPLPAGTIAEDVARTVHWDGAKTVPTVIEIVGDGPAPDILVDKNGKLIDRHAH